MVANLRADNIDGFLAPDPVNQRAVYDGVGYIHILSKDIWDRHPCCAFAASKEFVTGSPNTYAALLKAIIDATAFASKQENRKQIAEAIAPANYLNQPVTVVEQVLTGTFADGNNVRRVPVHRFRSLPLGIVSRVDHDADEALGTDQGRHRLFRRRQAGVPAATPPG
jgi:nitrate/nitrite transport system substrate-binding protein